MRPFDGRRILLVVSGGIAAYKTAYLVRRLAGAGASVDLVMTASAQRFIGAACFEGLTGRSVHTDLWEQPMAHLELGQEADAVVVAPATADLLARMAAGRADDLAAATLLAADRPLLLAPAMNTRMWRHPATQANVAQLRERGARLVGPESGELAEGEVGPGRMAEPDALLAEVGRLLEPDSPLRGRGVVVTAGPTRAPLDPVRFVSNRSSGRMGYALAAAAWRRGAEVVLITGPGSRPMPYGPRVVEVEESDDMLHALRDELPGSSLLLMVAAVSDYVADRVRTQKIKREENTELRLTLRAGPDLLEETRELRRRENVFSVGFALETEDPLANARTKLEEKALQMVALNEVGGPDTGFEAPSNRVTILDQEGEVEELPLLPKEEVAERLLDRVEEQLGA